MHTKEEKIQAFARLLDIMDELREKCPWNAAQTMESIRPMTEEEVYELSDAINQMMQHPGAFLLQCAVMEEDNVMPMCPPGHDVDDMILSV